MSHQLPLENVAWENWVCVGLSEGRDYGIWRLFALTRPSATLSRKQEKDKTRLLWNESGGARRALTSPRGSRLVLLLLAGEGGRRPGEGTPTK